MKVTMNNNEAVPIIFTHRLVTRMPKVNVTKKFLGITTGIKNLLSNVAIKALDLIDESFWIENKEVVDPGESKVVHYAVDVEDDGMEPERALLIATKLHGTDRPGCGAHFEVIKVLDDKQKQDDVIRASPGDARNEKFEDRLGHAKIVGDRPKPAPKGSPKLPRPTRFGIDIGPEEHEDGDNKPDR